MCGSWSGGTQVLWLDAGRESASGGYRGDPPGRRPRRAVRRETSASDFRARNLSLVACCAGDFVLLERIYGLFKETRDPRYAAMGHFTIKSLEGALEAEP